MGDDEVLTDSLSADKEVIDLAHDATKHVENAEDTKEDAQDEVPSTDATS